MSKGIKYKMTFRSAGFMLQETVRIAELFIKHDDWEKVFSIAQKDKVLQTRTESTTKRYLSEIKKRLTILSSNHLEILEHGTLDEQKQINWWAICNTYNFIKEFAIEVIHSKYAIMDYNLDHIDYIQFYEQKSLIDPSLSNKSTEMRKKIEQDIFRMTRETGIIDNNNIIQPVYLSDQTIKVMMPDKPDCFLIFPITKKTLRGLL